VVKGPDGPMMVKFTPIPRFLKGFALECKERFVISLVHGIHCSLNCGLLSNAMEAQSHVQPRRVEFCLLGLEIVGWKNFRGLLPSEGIVYYF
jgi:hypothetical protein